MLAYLGLFHTRCCSEAVLLSAADMMSLKLFLSEQSEIRNPVASAGSWSAIKLNYGVVDYDNWMQGS